MAEQKIRPGCRVRLNPSRRSDVVDLALAGRIAVVDRLERGMDGSEHVVVSLLDDPAFDLGPMSQLGHRFFFAPDEVEPISAGTAPRLLVASAGDERQPGGTFGREVLDTLRRHGLPTGARTADFGIRTADFLAALGDCDVAVLVCAARRDDPPGSLAVAEVTPDELGRLLGGTPPETRGTCRSFVVTCEPRHTPPAAVPAAALIITSLVDAVARPR
ncbi:hypothetical protein GCM10011581_25030 [Saccharopolyspora subtropica]|uniref:Uncharacterized protein n=1 Tax=Saccharopolyspora thermophila TaxID=89367 RepID=A0A917JUM5_9PSEU|nr:hypothetical protein [Saccharopolyspora subtropica]GGI86913.1 hypothetical protein GCM10011581_25030 [Saccharopolyspora subtropica]